MPEPNYATEDVRGSLGPSHQRFARYQSFAGTDIQAIMYLPLLTLGNATKSNALKFKVFAELQTISVSSTRSVSPVRVLGRSSAIDYTRGARTIAGSMVFASINADAFNDVYDVSIAESVLSATSSLVSDQLPPFSIVITAANESGGVAIQAIHGITLTNYGTTYSIDDLYTETIYSYVATDMTPLIRDSVSTTRNNRRLDSTGKILSAPSSLTSLIPGMMGKAYGSQEAYHNSMIRTLGR